VGSAWSAAAGHGDQEVDLTGQVEHRGAVQGVEVPVVLGTVDQPADVDEQSPAGREGGQGVAPPALAMGGGPADQVAQPGGGDVGEARLLQQRFQVTFQTQQPDLPGRLDADPSPQPTSSTDPAARSGSPGSPARRNASPNQARKSSRSNPNWYCNRSRSSTFCPNT
jgi:hypothetical protein